MHFFNNELAVIFLTYNNESHIEKSLESIDDFCKVYIIDSGSSDQTLSIAKSFGAEIIINRISPWDAGAQRNHIYKLINKKHKWLLYLDSDEGLTEDLKKEIAQKARESHNTLGYSVRSGYRLCGRNLENISRNTYHDRLIRGGLNNKIIFTPSPGEVFYKRDSMRIGKLDSPYWHDVDAKGNLDWYKRVIGYQYQNGYIDSQYLFSTRERDVKNFGKIRKYRILLTIFLPIMYFFYYIYERKSYKDGLHGIYFTIVMSAAYFFYPFGYIKGILKSLMRI